MKPRIAIIGDRGIPARYSGYSTLVEELATRLVANHGMDVTVYCRRHYYAKRPSTYRGVRCVYLPAPGGKNFESIVHSNLSIWHAAMVGYDLAFVLDPGNAPFVGPLILRSIPRLMHTDGLGWKRPKWNRLQRRYYKWSEWVSARASTWMVADSRAMQRFYEREYGTSSSFIPYGSVFGETATPDVLRAYGVEPGGYMLAVARVEPDNNVDLIINEYKRSSSRWPLIVVGEARHPGAYAKRILAQADDRVRCVGAIWDPGVLNALYRHCRLYIHGHEVGGTNPGLLRAMGQGAPCLPLDVEFHREVLGQDNGYFTKTPGDLAQRIDRLSSDPEPLRAMAERAKQRANGLYRWDAVADGYARLFVAVLRERAAGARFRPDTGFEPYRPAAFVEPMTAAL